MKHTIRLFEETLRFSVWGKVQKRKPGLYALSLVYIDQNDLDQSIILFRVRSSYRI